jgi:hypothetical protein
MAVNATQHATPQLATYACPMHPQIRQAAPGQIKSFELQIQGLGGENKRAFQWTIK